MLNVLYKTKTECMHVMWECGKSISFPRFKYTRHCTSSVSMALLNKYGRFERTERWVWKLQWICIYNIPTSTSPMLTQIFAAQNKTFNCFIFDNIAGPIVDCCYSWLLYRYRIQIRFVCASHCKHIPTDWRSDTRAQTTRHLHYSSILETQSLETQWLDEHTWIIH